LENTQVALTVLALFLLTTYPESTRSMEFTELTDFAKRYAEAWSSQEPELLASFYTEEGTLVVSDGEPAVGREAIAEKAQGFMEAFPDMVVKLRAIQKDGDGAVFHWLWTGTNTGPGGTGRPVRIKGHEEWTFSAEGLIEVSEGHYDQDDYLRQVNGPEEAQ
jgi:uncharacterized protein (TIGR02246 family)